MSLLRIYGSLTDPPQRCQWALVNNGREPVTGEGKLAELPRRADRIQLVVPAAQVLITRAHVPQAARRQAGSALAFAVEEQTAGEPNANQVSWLGAVGEDDVLAVVDKPGLKRWRDALAAVGIRGYEVHCETLLLPWATDEWSLAWNGSEGFVRTGEFEGAATDCGDRTSPPLSLRLMLEEVLTTRAGLSSIAIYPASPEAAPDIATWQGQLGIAVRLAETRDWRTAPPDAGIGLAQEREPWRGFSGVATRLRPAAWILGAVLVLHAAALVVDWRALENEQRSLRQQMEARFRATFPEAVAVVDPVLQMRRQLAEARHGAGQTDSGDFLPMIGNVAAALKELPTGAVRVVSYERGRMTLELAVNDDAALQRILTRLAQSGLRVDPAAAVQRPGGATAVITVRAA
jgi:general secretion pathway protein L